MSRSFALGLLFMLCAGPLSAQVVRTVVDGGTIVTTLSANIRVNEASTLSRSWVVLNDNAAPMSIKGVGVRTVYANREYVFRPEGTVVAQEPIVAFQVRILLFDVFGNHMKTLSGTEVRDLAGSAEFQASEIGSWTAYESEVSRYLTSVTFVSYVRTASGRVWAFDEDAVAAELVAIQLQVSEGDLGEDGTD